MQEVKHHLITRLGLNGFTQSRSIEGKKQVKFDLEDRQRRGHLIIIIIIIIGCWELYVPYHVVV